MSPLIVPGQFDGCLTKYKKEKFIKIHINLSWYENMIPFRSLIISRSHDTHFVLKNLRGKLNLKIAKILYNHTTSLSVHLHSIQYSNHRKCAFSVKCSIPTLRLWWLRTHAKVDCALFPFLNDTVFLFCWFRGCDNVIMAHDKCQS